jgi:hypothetical protein
MSTPTERTEARTNRTNLVTAAGPIAKVALETISGRWSIWESTTSRPLALIFYRNEFTSNKSEVKGVVGDVHAKRN